MSSSILHRNEKGDLIYTKFKGLEGEGNTDIEAKELAIMEALAFCQTQSYLGFIIEINPLTLGKMIDRQ